MPRQARLVHSETPHHITLRGNNRRRIFSYASDYRYFLILLKTAALQFDCRVHAWCLMSNHVHIVVTPPTKKALGDFVKRFAQVYAQHRNKRMRASGKLFEERYWSKPCKHEAQLAATIAYVELNPVRANTVQTPGEYRWSSFLARTGRPFSVGGLWAPCSWYRSLGRAPGPRFENYCAWLREYEQSCRTADEAAVALSKSQKGRAILRPDGTRAA